MRRFLALICAGVLTLALAPVALAAAPTNDEKSGATVVSLTPDAPFVDILDTTEATVNATDPMRPGPYPEDPPIPIGPTVWYMYTAAETATIVIDLTGSSYVPSLLMLHADGTFMNLGSDVIMPDVVAGETYYFVIGDEVDTDGFGGMLRLSVSVQAPDPIPVEAQIAVTGASIVDGELLVTGTLTTTGEYASAGLQIEAAQRGKAPVTGVNSITAPGAEWTVSVPAASSAWRAARTSVTVTVWFMDSDGLSVGWFSHVAAVRAVQVAPEPLPELGSVTGRFTVTEQETGESSGVTIDLWFVQGEYGATPTGQFTISSGHFAGTYEPYQIALYVFDGYPAATVYSPMSNGHEAQMMLHAAADGQWVSIAELDVDWTVLDGMAGPVTKKSFTIVMPAE